MDAFRPQVSGTPEAMIRSFVFKNVSSYTIPGYGCMRIVQGIGAEEQSNRAVVYCDRPDSESAELQDSSRVAFNYRNEVAPGQYGRCTIGGYPVKATGVAADPANGLKIVADSFDLEEDERSKCAFVSVGSLGGTGISYVMASGSSVNLVRFVLTEALQVNGTAQAITVSNESSTGTGIVVSDWAGNSGEAGDRGIAWKDGNTYRVIEIRGGSSDLVRFTLDENIDETSHLAGATITSLGDDDGESIEVTDWCENGGKSGDKGVAWKTKNGDDEDVYYIIEILHVEESAVVKFQLSADLANTRGATALATVEGETGSKTLVNWGRHWAIDGAKGTAWKTSDGAGGFTYTIIDVEPVATRVRGEVVTTFTCVTSFVTLDTLKGMGGDIPPGGEIEARNYGFAATEGAQARAEYNQTDDVWELTWVPVTPVTSVHITGGQLRYDTTCTPNNVVVEITSTCP
jgi:hypothetical protein